MDSPAVFISYSREDLDPAVRLEQALKEQGLKPWRDQESLYAGQQWPKALGDAISSNDFLLLLWSQHSAESHFVEFEWTTAIALRKTIIPCLLDDTPLVPALISFNGIPMQDVDSSIPRILETFSLVKPAKQDLQRKSSVLKQLQEVAPGDAEAMARSGTILVTKAVAKAGDSPVSSRVGPTPEAGFEGMTIGDRYQVVKMLGRGGMGAVYQVYDSELERDAALKVIRADMADEPTVVQRFKREIQLSSEVTHGNVLRVFDLGESDGVKFLTMQYVDGQELTAILERDGALPRERIINILRQTAEGLRAAHEKSVIHRDLKPANILIDSRDHVYLTDFGLATSSAKSGLTQAGDVMGTPHYMSPEQVRGEPADAQADIYSLGVILYEMATGQLPFTGDTMYEIMMQRTVKDPTPAKQVNSEIPDFLDKIIQGCMARDKAARYASINELLEDLEEGALSGQTIMMTRLKMRSIRRKAGLLTWKKLAIIVPLVLICLLGGWAMYRQFVSGPAVVVDEGPREPVSVLIADFDNRVNDPLFDGVLEEQLSTGLEGASFVTTFNRGSARKIADQLQPGAEKLDEDLSRLVAQREGINVIVTGAIEADGDGYEVSVRAIDALTGEEMETASTSVEKKADVLGSLGRLSSEIRATLGDTTPESAQLAAAETYTASSLEAAQALAGGLEAFGEGKWEEAVTQYEKAIELDPGLGRAYAGLAAIHRNDGEIEQAEEQFQLAMRNIDRMSERERFKVRGGYFLVTGNYPKAVEELSALIENYPADFVGQINLALSLFLARDMEGARQAARRATEIYPKNVMARTNLALYAMYASDFEEAIEQSEGILEDYPDYADLYLCLGLSRFAEGSAARASEHYRKLSSTDEWGASMASMGYADIALLQGKLPDAVEILKEGITADLESGDTQAAARKSLSLARVQVALGNKGAALAQVEKVVTEQKKASLLYEAGLVFLEAEQTEEAIELAAGLEGSLRSESKLYGLLIHGEAELSNGNVAEAIRLFTEAQDLSDSWLGRFSLGKAYLAGEAYTEAYSEFEQCIQRRGESVAVFLDDVPSYHYFPPVYYYMGLAQEGLQSPGAVQSFRSFLEMRGESETDPMVEEARQRVASTE
jgi:tetratricopeptide (TPR) repeat protein/tRNA A-37 threonylcarbamoyl transferase component Bud32